MTENFIFMDFFAVKVDGSDVNQGICLYENLFTDTLVDVTSVNFNSKKVYEDEIFSQQDILQFFSGESKEYKYLKSPQTVIDTLKNSAYSGSFFNQLLAVWISDETLFLVFDLLWQTWLESFRLHNDYDDNTKTKLPMRIILRTSGVKRSQRSSREFLGNAGKQNDLARISTATKCVFDLHRN